MLGQPEGVGALAGADVERPAGGEAAGLVDERAVGVAAPDPVAAVTVIPIGFVGRWSGGGSDVLVGNPDGLVRLGTLLQGAAPALVDYADDPYGVQYWVIRWVVTDSEGK